MSEEIVIRNKKIGENNSVYIIAEMSANHNMDFECSKRIIYLT